MRIRLKDLKPNPYRDFRVDPFQPDIVENLKRSIDDYGFWGGVVCRRVGDDFQIAAGHHRIQAAIEAGVEEADLAVGNFDDAQMSVIYATENATQRGAAATGGAIAAAIRFLAWAILSEEGHISQNWENPQDLETLRGNLASEKGVGEPVITRFLSGVPGIKKSVVMQQLANLKASGDYQRIIREVTGQIEEQKSQELALLEDSLETSDVRKSAQKVRQRARRTAQEVNGQEPIFDYEGVARHLKNDSQISTFRKAVTSKGIRELLPMSKQAALAKEVVAQAESLERELSAAFIKETVTGLVIEARRAQRELTALERKQLEERDITIRFDRYQDDFSRNVRGMHAAGLKLLKLMKEHRSVQFRLSGEFRNAVKNARATVEKLAANL